jgi:2-dehydropantoate 2-reductase
MPHHTLEINMKQRETMNILIYGAGAIGSHIAYCMHSAGHRVYILARGEHFFQMKQKGLHIKLYDNQRLKDEKILTESPRFLILNSLEQIEAKLLDCIFITVKLSSYVPEFIKDLQPYMGADTAVIPPCTKLPFWFFYNLSGDLNSKYNNLDFDPDLSQYFRRENIIGMTMWLSAVIEGPGKVALRHTQRGYPLKEIHPKMRDRADKLREIFELTCMSPVTEDIRSEMFIKSINAFAFNMVALDTGYNNEQLNNDKNSKECIKKIMAEGDRILEILSLPIIQNIESRILQTLSSSKHTMSMLHDYNNGKNIELPYIWSGFKSIASILGVNMKFSEVLFHKVMDKCGVDR